MKKRVFSLFSVITLVIASLFILLAVGNVYANDPDEWVDSNWLANDGEPYLSDKKAGSTTGYGRFLLGEEDVTLTANAEEGFYLAGWRIVYIDNPTIVTYIDSSDLIIENGVASKTLPFGTDGNETTIRFDFIDTDEDGYYDQGSFNIAQVFENLQVSSVFDFIYYNLEISNLLEISTIDSYSNEEILGSDNSIYYTSKSDDGTYTHYQDAIISLSSDGESKMYYYGDVYSADGEYFTLHDTLTDIPSEQRVEYSLGAYINLDEVSGTI